MPDQRLDDCHGLGELNAILTVQPPLEQSGAGSGHLLDILQLVIVVENDQTAVGIVTGYCNLFAIVADVIVASTDNKHFRLQIVKPFHIERRWRYLASVIEIERRIGPHLRTS